MRFRLIVEYDGTDFEGWQIQARGRTVQGVMEEAIAQLFGHPVRVESAGRTDAGVHASAQVVCFDSDRALEPDTVQKALNALTPRDVSIRAVATVPAGFNPRRDARSRSYVYRILNRPMASPFWRRYAWHLARPLDGEAMNEAAGLLVGEHDFTSFRAAGCDALTPVRRVLSSEISRNGELVLYRIEATAFLRHMVRNLMGTLVEVGLGKRVPGDMPELLAARDRSRAAATAPPQGLCLVEVKY